MDLIATIYVAVCCLLLPFWTWRQEYDGRAYPLIGLSALYGIWLLVGGYVLPFNSVTIATFAIGLWFTASLIWTEQPHSSLELFNWFCYLLLFSAARSVPLIMTLWCVFLVGAIFACIQLYRQARNIPFDMYIYGNTSHNSAFLLSGVMSGVWLASFAQGIGLAVLLLFSVLMGLAVITTKSKGAIFAMFVALSFITFKLIGSNILFAVFTVLSIFSFWIYKTRFSKHGLNGSWRERVLIFTTAWEMIKRKPLMGHGLMMFRKLMPFIVANLHKKEWFDKALKDRAPEYNGDTIYANRVHNDHLETIIETGFIGYALLVYLFFQIPFDIFSEGFFIMAMVSSLSFFYFRNTHTAVPFWIVMGSAVGVGSGMGSILPLKLVGIAIICAIVSYIFKKFVGMAYFSASVVTEDLNSKLNLAQKALDCDSHNGLYLNYYAYYAFKIKPMESLFCNMKSLSVYDGNRQIWGLWDLLSRQLFNMDKILAAEWANENAIHFFSEYPQSKEMKNIIETAKIKMQEMTNKAEPKNFKKRRK